MTKGEAAALMWEAGTPIAGFLAALAVILTGLAVLAEINR